MALRIEPKRENRPGRKGWVVDLRRFGLGRLWFDTCAEAVRHITQVTREQEQFGQLAFDLPAETRRHYLTLEQRASDLGTTLEAALDWWQESHRITAQKTVEEAVAECLAKKTEANRRPRYLEQLRYSLESLAKAVGPKTVVSAITHDQVEGWLANPKWKAVKSRQGKLVDAGTLFNFCIRRGWCGANPCLAVEPFTLDEHPPGILTVAQVEKLLTVCCGDEHALLPVVALGTFCGIRSQELHQISWPYVHVKEGYVEVPAAIAKGRQRRLISIQPNAREWLGLGGILPPVNWRRAWIRVRQRAGFKIEKRDKGIPWPHNALRHSFCSYALPKFGAARTAEWAGHSETMLFKHYRELVTPEQAERFWAIRPAGPS